MYAARTAFLSLCPSWRSASSRVPAPPPPMLYSPVKSIGLVFRGLLGIPIGIPIVFAVGFRALRVVAVAGLTPWLQMGQQLQRYHLLYCQLGELE